MLSDCHLNTDEVELHIDNAVIRVIRRLTYDLPHEVSAFIPRAEIRRRRYENGRLAWEEEVILNSLTVVHSPQRPPTGERPPAAGPGSGTIPAGPAGKSEGCGSVPEIAPPPAATAATHPAGRAAGSRPARLRLHYS
ncbi:hypothetical protein MTCOM_02150 [Moorella thermoacetica]|uniref:Uncharacterized protein n=1 Tax=Neomoorella thermoacetica TaxID=1525 RepID=A0A1J5K4V5_NEOTH|nr:hypothetical protein [Moorella thermoacetica]OIQ08129.1 hypothetical protein MOOR_23050 [Moorella thermoacetica]OIQ10737.1 hypothetical protein MOOTH_23760 [Moorella thermoacetica]